MQYKTTAAHDSEPMPFRCPNCNRLLFKGCIKYVEIKCPKCGCVHSVTEQFKCDGSLRTKTAGGKSI